MRKEKEIRGKYCILIFVVVVEVEVLGIPSDCYKYKTKMSQRNSLNPIWEDTFELEVKHPMASIVNYI